MYVYIYIYNTKKINTYIKGSLEIYDSEKETDKK